VDGYLYGYTCGIPDIAVPILKCKLQGEKTWNYGTCVLVIDEMDTRKHVDYDKNTGTL
jgi:hypothetical protein